MSHFEYVSVALALMYALVIGRLLSGLSPSFQVSRRYWIHATWIIVLLLVSVLQWWVFWRALDVTWTPIRFLWALSLPSIVFLRCGALLGDSPSDISSFREHYYKYRVPFFSLGIVAALQGFFSGWVLGIIPWFSFTPIHVSTFFLAALSLSGLVFKNESFHRALVLITLF